MQLHKHTGKVCNVFIGYDDTSAEQWAMLGAMYSRSNNTVESLIDKVKSDTANKFMDKFYVGYGHESIGDLVDVKLFIEHVPFYVACQLEHFSRFRGQESSTRYIDFSEQPCAFSADPVLYKKQIDRYLDACVGINNRITTHYKGELTKPIQRAIAARAFDIARGLLPWGATTNVAWYGDLRTIQQHLTWLASDKNPNRLITHIQDYVDDVHAALASMYPYSMVSRMRVNPNYPSCGDNSGAIAQLSEYGDLDFGGWRDLNRHRLAVQHVDFSQVGKLHPWYEEQLGDYAPTQLTDQGIDAHILGQTVSFECTILHDYHARYLSRLRTGLSVHPTLRQLIHNFANNKYECTPYSDVGKYGFYEIRGNQTILHNGEEL